MFQIIQKELKGCGGEFPPTAATKAVLVWIVGAIDSIVLGVASCMYPVKHPGRSGLGLRNLLPKK